MKDLARSHSTAIAAMGITLESGPKTCSRTEFGLEGLQCCSPPICYTENFWELGAWDLTRSHSASAVTGIAGGR